MIEDGTHVHGASPAPSQSIRLAASGCACLRHRHGVQGDADREIRGPHRENADAGPARSADGLQRPAGFSAVSNEFLSDVPAVLIAQHGMSPIQSAVLVWCIGKQKEGWVKATHNVIAERLGVERANVTRAINRLEEWHMIQKIRSGILFVNPLIGFMGNGDRQQEILATLRQGVPQDAFPKLNAPPAPRGVQMELGRDQEETAC
ncbi:MarR family transcriptional regulator [Streptomyces sp. NPDC059533]|uniref:MarR family transcriptional regulator n=1 Tax=unclassified Streptomyces TaxID=2593676 RepID=UPI0036817EBB